MDNNALQQLQFANQRSAGAANLGASALAHGRVVCQYDASSQSAAWANAVENCLGVEYPDADNVVFGELAILEASGLVGKVLAANQVGKRIRSGLCIAKVLVPANVNLSKGTYLIPATEWDATNNKTLFRARDTNGSTDTLYSGALEPFTQNTGASKALTVEVPANPIAKLRQALTATSEETVVDAVVEVIEGHRPMAFQWNFNAATWADAADVVLASFAGPGMITGYFLGATEYGSTADGTLDISIAPALSPPDVQSIFATTPILAHDSTNKGIYGTGLLHNGDKDDAAFSLGTNGRQGVLAAANLRVFPGKGLCKFTTVAPSMGSPAGLVLGVRGIYF